MGEDMVAIGFVVGLDYHDAILSPHDMLQQFKTHPMIRPPAGGRRAARLGRKDDPRGRLAVGPDRLSVPGAVLTGDSAGFVNVPKLKGMHYAMRSGMLAAEAIYEGLKAGADLGRRRGRSKATTSAYAEATSGATCGGFGTCARRSTGGCSSAAAWPA